MNRQTIDQDQIFTHLSNQRSWMRLVYMLVYGIILHIAGAILWIVCSVQFIFTVITGQDNGNLRNMAATLIKFVNDALRYVSYNSDEKPFPFANQEHGQEHPKDEPSTDSEKSDIIDVKPDSTSATEMASDETPGAKDKDGQ